MGAREVDEGGMPPFNHRRTEQLGKSDRRLAGADRAPNLLGDEDRARGPDEDASQLVDRLRESRGRACKTRGGRRISRQRLETNTGPGGAAIASWHARWIV